MYSIEYLEKFLEYYNLVWFFNNITFIFSCIVIFISIFLAVFFEYQFRKNNTYNFMKEKRMVFLVIKITCIFVLISIVIDVLRWYKQFKICWTNKNCIQEIQNIINQHKHNEEIIEWVKTWIFKETELQYLVDTNELITNLKK